MDANLAPLQNGSKLNYTQKQCSYLKLNISVLQSLIVLFMHLSLLAILSLSMGATRFTTGLKVSFIYKVTLIIRDCGTRLRVGVSNPNT